MDTNPPQNDAVLPKVLLLRPSALTLLPLAARLRAHFHLLDPLDSSEPAQSFLSLRCRSVRALLCLFTPFVPVNAGTLDLLPSLELIVVSSAGLEHVDLPYCRRRGIAVANASAAFCEDGADYAVAMLIDVMRRVSHGDRFVRAGSWPVQREFPLGFKLGGKRVGIVGLGSIGSKTAKRLVSFGCSIAYNSRKEKPHVPYPYYANVRDLAANSDILVLCCALTEGTRHIVGKDVMSALGKGGVIINVGRGALVDEKELVRRLVRGEIGGAGLDVFEKEPKVPDELLALDNVVLSPHRAVMTPESLEAVQELIIGNLRAFFSNEPLRSLVQHE
ncbi:glyoxylate/hydroxypyruvate reductase HPR3-like [Rhodamnia argentea]|uniref:Glyoxylate/hydroxypyruvate reductase HPR3-like n=1 Tax=Rhodamnia argentea TaxID=178133 RepID=A0A8B8NS35_9MYRT|nr:glyoxylate/hydroxypyruvate reductase HPR3-like [Rhodamnia argentea]